MGRPRKPLDVQKGHLKMVDYQKKEMEEQAVTTGADQLEEPPVWLTDAIAKNEWKRLVKELKKIEIIGNLDLNNLGAYCNAYSGYRKATKELVGATLTVEKWTKYGPQMVPNPLIAVQSKYSDEMRRYASLCGLTIDSRLKAGTGKVNKQEETLERKFGLI